MDSGYDLERFVNAQNAAGAYGRAVEELRRGRKTSHWMWFVFPQIAGLGQSTASRTFAISSLDEARAYLQHDVLGARLKECASIVAQSPQASAEAMFGTVDAQKLRSSMTLFMRAAPDEPVFGQVLRQFFDDQPDDATDRRISREGGAEPSGRMGHPPVRPLATTELGASVGFETGAKRVGPTTPNSTTRQTAAPTRLSPITRGR